MMSIPSSPRAKYKKFLDILNTGIRRELPVQQNVEKGISLQNVEFHIGALHMKIDELNFEKGKKYAIIGSNGSGKSTLLKLIMQYYKPASGEILLDGKPISELDTSVCISYVDQNEYIFQAGLEDNVTVYGSYPSIRKQILDRYWIRKQDNAGESDCQKMSGGEKQIIAFLRVVARDASIIIMDEPFSAMDAENTEKIQDYLLRSKEMSGKTVILITHDISAETLAKYDCIVRVNEFHCEL